MTGPKGQLVADYGRHKLLPEEQFKDFTPPKQTIAPSIGHHKEWIEAIKGNGKTLCNFAYSGALAETVLLGNVAYRSGKSFAWDDKAGTTDSAEAAKYLQRRLSRGLEAVTAGLARTSRATDEVGTLRFSAFRTN